MLIINANIVTMEEDSLQNGYILASGGKISKIGEMADAPSPAAGETVLDAGGRTVLPGLIDAHTHLGMFEDSLGFEGDDGNEESEPVTPQLRAVDAVNPMDKSFSEALMGGVTAVVTGPGSANPIAGQMLAMKTYGRRVDDMVIKQPAAMKLALGENPKTVYHGKNLAPVTRRATAALIRETLFKAKEYLEQKEKAAADEDEDAPDFDLKLEAMEPVLKGEESVHIHAHRADDIFTAIRIAKEFSLKYVIVHGTEGHLIAPELSAEGAEVICGPALSFRSKPELKNLSFETPGVLSLAGVRCAICTDHPETPIQHLLLCVSLAVKSGMDRQAALRAVTIDAARIAGIDGRVGSLKVGKDADMVIFSGDPLEIGTTVDCTIIDGKVVWERQICEK